MEKSTESPLSGSLFFGNLPDSDQQQILDKCKKRLVSRREVIVRQGESGRDMFIVLKGKLRVSSTSADGREISFDVLGQSDAFGELSLLDGEPRSATVTAIDAGELLVFHQDEFIQLLHQHPDVAVRMLAVLSRRLRATDELYRDSVFLEVPGRLAKVLLKLSEMYQIGPGGDVLIDMKLSQYELGTLANASRESVNKQLRAWEQEGIIEYQQGKIRLLHPETLESLVSGL